MYIIADVCFLLQLLKTKVLIKLKKVKDRKEKKQDKNGTSTEASAPERGVASLDASDAAGQEIEGPEEKAEIGTEGEEQTVGTSEEGKDAVEGEKAPADAEDEEALEYTEYPPAWYRLRAE
jgi:hypothetical protein